MEESWWIMFYMPHELLWVKIFLHSEMKYLLVHQQLIVHTGFIQKTSCDKLFYISAKHHMFMEVIQHRENLFYFTCYAICIELLLTDSNKQNFFPKCGFTNS